MKKPVKLFVRNGSIFTDDENLIGVLTENSSIEAEKSIELGSEALLSIHEFVSSVNSGKHKPREAVKKFESILNKI